MQLSQTRFERHVPSFANATDEVWRLVAPLASRIEATLHHLPQVSALDQLKERVTALRAAREALRHLDLVLTPSGFAVVRTDNLAPASKERVDALAEALRREESLATDDLHAFALRLGWGDTDEGHALVDSLLWCASEVYRLGLTHGGREVYAEEYAQLRPQIMAAHTALSRIVSLEQLDALIDDVRHPTRATAGDSYRLRELSLRFISRHIQGHSTALVERDILRHLRAHREQFALWAASSECRAQEATHYRNEADHATFFFG